MNQGLLNVDQIKTIRDAEKLKQSEFRLVVIQSLQELKKQMANHLAAHKKRDMWFIAFGTSLALSILALVFERLIIGG